MLLNSYSHLRHLCQIHRINVGPAPISRIGVPQFPVKIGALAMENEEAVAYAWLSPLIHGSSEHSQEH